MDTLKINSLSLIIHGSSDATKLAVVLPGFLDTKDYPHMKGHVEFLGNNGYLAVSFDPPGTWESDHDISNYTITHYLEAIDEVIAHFGNKPTLVVGHSLGGAMAMLAACRNPHVQGFVAIMSPYAYVRDDNEEKKLVEWQPGEVKVSTRDLPRNPDESREFKLPYSFIEDAIHYNALEGLKTLTKPKLFIIGKDDDVVPGLVTERAYTEAAEPKKLVVLDSDHDYRWHPELIEEVNQLLGAFCETLLS
ncbi:MAG TPA: alpha/beta hydrolase [Patescibacteria group bacterium]